MDTLPSPREPGVWGTNMELVTLEEGPLAASHPNASSVGHLTAHGGSPFTTTPGHSPPGDINRDDVCLILEEEDLHPGRQTGADVGHMGPCLEEAYSETYPGEASGGGDDCDSDSWDYPPHPYYAPFYPYPIKVLSRAARRFLSDHLNQMTVVSNGRLQNNWEGLAECTGRMFDYVSSKQDTKDPCGELLSDWEQEEGLLSSIGKLLVYLQDMGRADIIEDVSFTVMIAESVKEYNKGQEELANISEETHNTRPVRRRSIRTQGEATSGEQEKFDAYVCYDEADTDFIMELIYELEHTEGLKVCLNARDLILGHEADVTAEMIKSRCKRTLVILSETFVSSGNPMCDFALKIAQSLSPAASESKLVPIRIDQCEVPDSLLHMEAVDFELCYVRAWLWGRLAATLRLPEEELLMVEKHRLRRVILRRSHSGSVTDVRASMRQTRYIPPLPARRRSSSSSSRRTGSTSSSSEEPSRLPPGLSRSRGPSFRDRFWSFLSGSRSSLSGR